jgi:hypothetical protein
MLTVDVDFTVCYKFSEGTILLSCEGARLTHMHKIICLTRKRFLTLYTVYPFRHSVCVCREEGGRGRLIRRDISPSLLVTHLEKF